MTFSNLEKNPLFSAHLQQNLLDISVVVEFISLLTSNSVIVFFFSDGVLVPSVPELPAGPDPLYGDPPSLVPPPGHVPRPPLPCPLTLHIRL